MTHLCISHGDHFTTFNHVTERKVLFGVTKSLSVDESFQFSIQPYEIISAPENYRTLSSDLWLVFVCM